MLEKRFRWQAWLPGLRTVAGSFIIAVSWGWYHFSKHPKWVFAGKELAAWAVVTVGFVAVKALFTFLVVRFRRHSFWQETFFAEFDALYLYGSFFFLIFFIQTEWQSLAWVLVLLPIFFFRLQKAITHHPGKAPWLAANRAFFGLCYFLLVFEAAVQFTAYHFYILDSNIRFFNIVLFRSVAMMLFWLLGFLVSSYVYWRCRSAVRYSALVVWFALFAFDLFLWIVNIEILYFSGLYFNPIELQYVHGSGGVVANVLTYFLIVGSVLVLILFGFITKKALRGLRTAGERHATLYIKTLGIISLLALVSLSSFRNTPEHDVISSFYNYYFGKTSELTLDPVIAQKLRKFGLSYQSNEFYVNSRSSVFSTSTVKQLLPERLLKNKPNIVIIFVESFSARLSDVYSAKFPGVTPNFLAFSQDPHTTVFSHYYNASTPTITGTLSQLCSFLPPTGYEEIQLDHKLQNHHLLCLPEVLKKDAGYKTASYVTAVEKEFENKDGIFTSAGVDTIFGTQELKQYIPGEPLSWGYSDHQLFPAIWNFMQTAPQPFLMMLATVDSHPPFNLAKDAVNYDDGSRPVLNSFHTTDDAFGKFWNEFKASPFYTNTIVVAVADHAIFPGALTTDLFPEEARTLTYYDQNFFSMYIPDSVLPKSVDVYSSGIDVTPTLLQLLNINIPNSFEGHSIFDDQAQYPNVLGMHELELYINQISSSTGKRVVSYDVPSSITCDSNYTPSSTPDFTLCDYKQFYSWKRQMFEQGRFWKH